MTERVAEKTATLEARFAGLPGEVAWKLADALMLALDAHSAAVGPMVVANSASGELTLSFEFVGVGDPSVDVPRGMEIIAEATANAATLEVGRAVERAKVLGVSMGWAPDTVVAPELALA